VKCTNFHTPKYWVCYVCIFSVCATHSV
jgi:hypothetical protein